MNCEEVDFKSKYLKSQALAHKLKKELCDQVQLTQKVIFAYQHAMEEKDKQLYMFCQHRDMELTQISSDLICLKSRLMKEKASLEKVIVQQSSKIRSQEFKISRLVSMNGLPPCERRRRTLMDHCSTPNVKLLSSYNYPSGESFELSKTIIASTSPPPSPITPNGKGRLECSHYHKLEKVESWDEEEDERSGLPDSTTIEGDTLSPEPDPMGISHFETEEEHQIFMGLEDNFSVARVIYS